MSEPSNDNGSGEINEDAIENVAELRHLVKKYKTAATEASNSFAELQSKMTMFVTKYQKLDQQLKMKNTKLKEVESKLSQSILMQSQAQVAVENAAAFEAKAMELERALKKCQSDLNETVVALRLKTSQYENVQGKLNEMALAASANAAEDLKKLRDTNKKLKLETESLRGRVQQLQNQLASSSSTTRASTTSFSAAASSRGGGVDTHVVSSSDDEAANYHLNSSFTGIKSEDEAPEPSTGGVGGDDDDDGLLALLDEGLASAQAESSVSSSVAVESSFREPKKRAKASAAAKPTRAKRAASSTKKSAASSASAPISTECGHADEIQRLKDENARLRSQVAELQRAVDSYQEEATSARLEAQRSSEELSTMKKRLAEIMGFSFAAPAVSQPQPVAPPPPPSSYISPESLSSTLPPVKRSSSPAPPRAPATLSFGLSEDDNDEMQVDLSDLHPPQPSLSPARSPSPSPAVNVPNVASSPQTSAAKDATATVAAASSSASKNSRDSNQAKKTSLATKKRSASSVASADDSTTEKLAERPAKRPKTAESQNQVALPKYIASSAATASPAAAAAAAVVATASSSVDPLQAALRTLPPSLHGETSPNLILSLFKQDLPHKCLSEKALHAIIVLSQRLCAATREECFQLCLSVFETQEKDSTLQSIAEQELDPNRFGHERLSIVLDVLAGEDALSFIQFLSDTFFSVQQRSLFVSLSFSQVIIHLCKRRNLLQRARVFLIDIVAELSSTASCIACVSAIHRVWKSVLRGKINDSPMQETLRFVLTRCAQDIKKSHTPIHTIFQRTKADLGWNIERDTGDQGLPDFRTCFTSSLDSYVTTMQDSLLVFRGQLPPALELEITKSLRIIDILCARMPDAWIRSKLLNWISQALVDAASTRDVQARLLRALAPVIVRLWDSSKDSKAVQELLSLLNTVLSSPLLSKLHRSAASDAAISVLSCSTGNKSLTEKAQALNASLGDYFFGIQ